MKFSCRNLATAVAGAAITLSMVTPASGAVQEVHQGVRQGVRATAGFKCSPADGYRHTKRRAPIRNGMSAKASVKAMVSKGRVVHFRYRCTNAKGTRWVKTVSPAKGYLAAWNLKR